MIEVKMRVDDDIDLGRIAVDRFEPGANFFARPEGERKEPGDARSNPRRGVGLAIGMQPSVKEDCPFGVLNQIGGDRQVRPTLSALHQAAEIPGQPATCQREKGHTQNGLLKPGNRNRSGPVPFENLLEGSLARHIEERAQGAVMGERRGGICRRLHANAVVPIGRQTDLACAK